MQELIGKEVEVRTPDMVYRGVLIEAGEQDLYLQSEMGGITVPLDRVVDIKAGGKGA